MNPMPTSPVPKPSVPLAQNRRGGHRHQLQIPATLMAVGITLAAIEVTVTEFSVGGIGLRTSHSLVPETVYQLSSFDTLIPPGMRVKILSQQPLANGEFKIGAQTLA